MLPGRRQILRIIARHGASRIAMASLRQGKDVQGRGQMRQHALEGAPGVGDAVQQ